MTYEEALKELKHEIDMLPNEPPSDFVVNENVWFKEHEKIIDAHNKAINTYEHLLDEILNWPEWKLKAAIKFRLFSSKTECSVLRYLIKVRKNTLAETLDSFIAEPVKPYTKEGAYRCLQKLGILDEIGEITPAFQDIVVRKD